MHLPLIVITQQFNTGILFVLIYAIETFRLKNIYNQIIELLRNNLI